MQNTKFPWDHCLHPVTPFKRVMEKLLLETLQQLTN